jgi:hypothetical protein
MRIGVIAAILVVTFSLPQVGYVARAPDITKQRFELRNAKTFADFLGSGRFELSQAAEHRAMPTHDAALRESGGGLSELQVKISTAVTETASWDGNVLRMEGYVADITTAYPHLEVPRWSFSSPQFPATAVPHSWNQLYQKLLVLPPKPSVQGDERMIDFVLGDDQRAVITLYRADTYDMTNQPVVRWSINVAFGPVVPKQMPSQDSEDSEGAVAPPKKSGC